MAQRHDEILSELADLGLTLARDLQARALAAADDGVACELALAFHRVSRSLRQTLALESRLERERRLGAREAAQDAQRETLARVQRRRAQVRAALARAIWDEAEGEDAESLLEDLDGRLMDEALDDGFVEAPIEACIDRIRADLGLAAAKAAQGANDAAPDATTPDATIPDAAPSVVIWKSSA